MDNLAWIRVSPEDYYPEPSIENCVVINSNTSSIFLAHCTELNGFICEYRSNSKFLLSNAGLSASELINSRKVRHLLFKDVKYSDEKDEILTDIANFKESLLQKIVPIIDSYDDSLTTTTIASDMTSELILSNNETSLVLSEDKVTNITDVVSTTEDNLAEASSVFKYILDGSKLKKVEENIIQSTTFLPTTTTIDLPIVDYETWKKVFIRKTKSQNEIYNDQNNAKYLALHNDSETFNNSDQLYTLVNNQTTRNIRGTEVNIDTFNLTDVAIDNKSSLVNGTIVHIINVENFDLESEIIKVEYFNFGNSIDLITKNDTNTETNDTTVKKMKRSNKRIIVYNHFYIKENNGLHLFLIGIILIMLFFMCYIFSTIQNHYSYSPANV